MCSCDANHVVIQEFYISIRNENSVQFWWNIIKLECTSLFKFLKMRHLILFDAEFFVKLQTDKKNVIAKGVSVYKPLAVFVVIHENWISHYQFFKFSYMYHNKNNPRFLNWDTFVNFEFIKVVKSLFDTL